MTAKWNVSELESQNTKKAAGKAKPSLRDSPFREVSQ